MTSPRKALALVLTAALVATCLLFIQDPVHARAAVIASVYLILLLTEVVPPFVPALLLLFATPILLGSFAPSYQLTAVLTWPADPVLALFAGGLALGLAAKRHGIDLAIAGAVLRLSGAKQQTLMALVLLGTAGMSMWMSNIAAAAVMLTSLRPALSSMSSTAPFRRAVLLSVAIGANLGGIATPIGSGPNAIAIAAAWERHPISFLGWMIFALPLVLAMLGFAYLLLMVRYKVHGVFERAEPLQVAPDRKKKGVFIVFLIAVAAWISEPFHGVSAPLIALALTFLLFAAGFLRPEDLGALDWSTIGLIGGGIALGKLVERTSLLSQITPFIDGALVSPIALLGALALASALLSAIMSNTATAALLVPLGMSLSPSPATGVIIAIAASFGMPFVISTPPNAMVYGERGVASSDLLWVGLPIMFVGCTLVALTGIFALRIFGVP
jgi:sodium-dependent dicarboxylate transporter 2/3/5